MADKKSVMTKRGKGQRGRQLSNGHYRVTVYLNEDHMNYLELRAAKEEESLSGSLRLTLSEFMRNRART